MAITIQKPDSTSAIIVDATVFQDKPYVDVRSFYSAGDELKPTKKGCMIPLEVAVEVAQAILAEADVHAKAKSKKTKYYVFMPSKIEGKMQMCRIDESEVFEKFEEIRAKTVEDFDATMGYLYRVVGTPDLNGSKYVFNRPKLTLIGKWSKNKKKWLKVEPPKSD